MKSNSLKFALFCLFFNFFIIETQAQVTRSVIKEPETVDLSNSYIGAFFGVSVPIDQFASIRENEDSGFAKTHVKINVDGAYVFARNLGIAGTLGYFVNGSKSIDYFSQFKDGLVPDETAITNSNWRNTYCGVGPFFSLPESKLYFEGRALLGVNRTTSPLLRLRGETDIQRSESIAWSPAFVMGLGFGYRLTKHWRLVFQTEYFLATPMLEANHTIIEDGFTQNTVNTYRQRITHFGLSLGMQLDLTAKIER